jgi:acyl carrier protein
MQQTKSLTKEELTAVVLKHMRTVAPEADLSTLPPSADIRERLDIDSFDFLNFLIALNGELGVEVPEKDYGQVNTLDHLTAYLLARMG